MIERPEETYDLYSLVERFCYDLCEELEYHKISRRYLTFEEYKVLREYYREWNLETFKYFVYSQTRLLRHIVKYIMSQPQHPRILDAGCGLGSQAIFFGILGADVTGVDLNRERLDIANKRVKYYQEKYGEPLHVKFHLKNILNFREYNKFDVVWSNQSVSHIHPVQDFLKVAWKNLENGGYLIICDSNGINPHVAFHAWLVHRNGGVYTQVNDPHTCQPIPYARERMLNPPLLNKLLRKIGYSIELVEYHGFVPPNLILKKLFRSINEVLTNIPLIRMIGGTYIIVCKKAE